MSRYDSGGYYGGWAPYVSVAERRKQAAKKIAALQKKGATVTPVIIDGRTIARTFWGKAWCDNLESYSDYENRLPRGRTYVRNGSVIDLRIERGEIKALVSGSNLYTVKITIRPLERTHWKTLIARCAGQIDSLVELLKGKFSRGVMEIITCRDRGLFPSPKEITLRCSCPDSAIMCKHVAAVLYGVGARLDEKPELFFQLRNVDYSELITAAGTASAVVRPDRKGKILRSDNLSSLFGIELDTDTAFAPAITESLETTRQRKAASTKPSRKSAPRKRKRAEKHGTVEKGKLRRHRAKHL